MAITFHPDGRITGNKLKQSGMILKVQSDEMYQTTAFGSSSSAYQSIDNKNFVTEGTNSNLLVQVEINGAITGSSNADRNFKMDYNVAGGSYTDLNYNTVNTHGNNSNNMFGNVRGDGAQNGGINIFTTFLIVGNGIWSAGQTLNFRLFTIGESTFAMNIAYSDAASVGSPSRFGRAVSKIQFTEIST